MAQKKSTSTSGRKTTTSRSTAAKKNTGRSGAAAAKTRARHSRVTYTLVFFALGVFSLLGYFNNDGVFIRFLRGFMSGILGGGFYLLPPALLLCAMLYGVSGERPKTGRIVCILLIPVLVGAICQIFSKAVYRPEFSAFSDLWEDGKELHGGGALAGFISVVFIYLFSKIGAGILLFCLSIAVLLTAFGIRASDVIEKVKSYAADRAEYREQLAIEREEEERQREEERKKRAAEELKNAQRAAQQTKTQRRPAIDIPYDGDTDSTPAEPEKKPRKASLFNKTPNTISPDELMKPTEKPEEPEAPEKPAVKPEEPKPVVTPPVVTPPPVTPPAAAPVVTPPIIREPAATKPAAPEPPAVKPPEPIAKEESGEKSFEELIEESAKRDLADAMQVYKFPPISLLEAPKLGGTKDAESELDATRDRLEMILHSFGINANISNIINGPSVTRYEMELEIGVKLNKLTSLSDDIALALGVGGVRIAAIPNKISTVGIEVPNKHTSTVYLREVISSPEFEKASSKLTFALGKNIGGEVMVGNINKLPHLLIAGTTGSGKSVSLNSLILSLMYKATPDEVKFIMIDPKMVEFKIYNGIPHLLVPVVTEAKKAAGALQWAVTEMMKRYRLFSDVGARDIAGYNEHMKQSGEQPIPFIVVIIDELADLMLVAAKEVEESICRVAQMGRAAGVHLVIATQSPRADVITGLMKANIPSRISFKVASALESRIILDAGGAADKLMGNGDMLYAPIGTSKPVRIQGTWVSDEEREQIVEYVKSSCEASYSEDVIHEIEKAAEDKNGGAKAAPQQEEKGKDYDELLPQAVDVIFDTNQASVSMLQRRLKLGYARAARLVDQMEEIGVLGPFEGSKPRQILITRQQWQEMQFINGTAPIEAAPAMPEMPVQPQGEPGQTMFSADDLFEDGGDEPQA